MRRREFLSVTGAGAAGLVLSGAGGALGASGAKRSTVVDVRNSEWRLDGQPSVKVISQMIEDGLKALSGKTTLVDAWREYVSPSEKVGLKFNNLSGNYTNANQAILDAIAAQLQQAGVKAENIIPIEAVGASYKKGPDPDFSRGQELDFGEGKTRLTKYITDQVDVLISIPNIKDHSIAGVTGALKNISHSNQIMTGPGNFHGNNCDPFIGAINAIPVIREKRRLTITNGLIGVFNRGPGTGNPNFHFPHNGFLMSTDPVAVDTYELQLIEAARKSNGLPSLFAGRNQPIHLASAAKMGLGTNNLDEIDIIERQA